MLSFWEKQAFLSYDVIIIGSGIVGLSTACSIKERFPKKSVLVLERGIFPTGASTKNAGFACYGSAAEILADVNQLGWARALEVVELRVSGLRKLRKRLGDKAIDYQEFGGGEIFLESDRFSIDQLEELNQNLSPFFGKPVFNVDPTKPAEFGFQTNTIHSFITNTVEGQIDTGMMMKNLLALTQQSGVTILTGCDVNHFERIGEKWQVNIAKSDIQFSCSDLIICTNAFAGNLIPNLDIKPGRGQVLITQPIANLQFKGIFHFNEGYYYFRNVGNRVLFGGGRNLDFEEETTTEFELNEKIQSQLEHYLKTLILPKDTHFQIEHRWAGIMAFGEEKVPILKDLGNGLRLGCRMNGMGIAMGTEIGDRLAGML